jgi:hypothetical protein
MARRSLFASRVAIASTLIASVLLSADSLQAADDKQVCLGAYISAQRLRQEDKLVEAREQLLTCARDVCPPTLKKDCTTWTAEVDQALPSVVIDARDSDGADVIDVKVTVDGKPFADRLDGKPRPLNPGVHTFRYETEGAPVISEKVVVRAGEKMRKVIVKFATTSKNPAPAPSATGKDPGESDTTTPDNQGNPPKDRVEYERPVPAGVYVFGAIGLAAFAGFTYFALKFDSQVNDLDACKPHCQTSQVDDAGKTRTISYIPLGIGIVSIGVAGVWFLARPKVEVEKKAWFPQLDVRQVSGGGLATFSARF